MTDDEIGDIQTFTSSRWESLLDNDAKGKLMM